MFLQHVGCVERIRNNAGRNDRHAGDALGWTSSPLTAGRYAPRLALCARFASRLLSPPSYSRGIAPRPFDLANLKIFTELPLHCTIRIKQYAAKDRSDLEWLAGLRFQDFDTRENLNQRTAPFFAEATTRPSLFSRVPGRAFGSLMYERSL
jgi:hypothetical protein